MTAKQHIITNGSTKCTFLYCAFMFYIAVRVHGHVRDLHLHYREYQLLMRRNAWLMTFLVMKGSPDILEILTDSFSTISAQPNSNFHMCRMPQNQMLHDKNIIIDINTTHWKIKLIVFSWTYELLILLMSVLSIWSIFFSTFTYGSEELWDSLDGFIFR